jgi:hypothetical protein
MMMPTSVASIASAARSSSMPFMSGIIRSASSRSKRSWRSVCSAVLPSPQPTTT